MPALAIPASMPPNASTVRSTAAANAPWSVTSAANQTAPGHSPATRSSSSGSSPTSATRAPRAASRRAVSAPIPRAAPVTSTARPLTSHSFIGQPSRVPRSELARSNLFGPLIGTTLELFERGERLFARRVARQQVARRELEQPRRRRALRACDREPASQPVPRAQQHGQAARVHELTLGEVDQQRPRRAVVEDRLGDERVDLRRGRVVTNEA